MNTLKAVEAGSRPPLIVPSEYADDFRAALIHEIAKGANTAKEERGQLEAASRWRPERVEARSSDLGLAMELLTQDAALLAEVGATGARELRLEADLSTLAHACETMAQAVVGHRLTDELAYSPIDGDASSRLRELMARLSWAVDNSARLHGLAFAQRASGGER